jgi:hypothetical protein
MRKQFAEAFRQHALEFTACDAAADKKNGLCRPFLTRDGQRGHRGLPALESDGKVKEANARSGGLDNRRVTRAIWRRHACPRPASIARRRAAELATKSAREDFVVRETVQARDLSDGCPAAEQTGRSPLQSKTLRVLLRRLAHGMPKRAMKMETGPPGPLRQPRERDIPVEVTPNVLQQVQKVFGAHSPGI